MINAMILNKYTESMNCLLFIGINKKGKCFQDFFFMIMIELEGKEEYECLQVKIE